MDVYVYLGYRWCPDEADDAIKTRYHNAKSALRNNLRGIAYEFYATHPDDLIYSEFVDVIEGN